MCLLISILKTKNGAAVTTLLGMHHNVGGGERLKTFIKIAFFIFLNLFFFKTLAQTYPNKPIRYVVAFPAGDSPDIVARLTADKLSHLWNQQVMVENRAGAGGTIAANFVAKSSPDGYLLFLCNSASNGIAPALYKKLTYDGLNDFTPISRIGRTPNGFNIHPSLPVKNLTQFVTYVNAHPGQLQYGHGGAGASPQLSMELFKLITHIHLPDIAYKGTTPALTDLLGGQIPVMVGNVPALISHAQSGKIKMLAVTGAKRISALPEVPTVIESGFAGFEVFGWYGLCGPAGLPTQITKKLHTDLLTILQQADLMQKFSELFIEIAPQTEAEFKTFISNEINRWNDVIQQAHIMKQ